VPDETAPADQTATTEAPDGSDAPGGPEAPTARVPRAAVLKRLTNLYAEPRYLEVGVANGHTFDRVPATRKVAVDPTFRFDHEAMQAANPGTEYHEVTSDAYFAEIIDPAEQFDVIYLDGLHVGDQTLRDLQNALLHLQPQGVIVIDDTRPPSHLAAIPDLADFHTVRTWLGSTANPWMGDVFKVVWFIASFMPGLSYATIENNHGQTVVWRRTAPVDPTAPAHPVLTMAQIAALTFDDLVLHEEVLQLARYGDIRKALRRDLGI